MKRVLGLMSGTSADGVSLALAGVGRGLEIVDYATYEYPKTLRAKILAAPELRTPELSWLNFALGRNFAAAAVRFLKGRRVDAAGSHGQTVIHLPDGKEPSTLQIGEPSFLAEALGVPVVSDFRPRDMAAGGQGAPLAPFLDEFLFGSGPARALQNIGGIGNVALVGKGVRTLGFDTGPGNCVIDLAVASHTRGRQAFDRDGRLAREGKPDEALARRLLSLPFFSRKPPKSLDRGAFDAEFLHRHFGVMLRRAPEDAIATITLWSALTIADAYRRFLPRRPAEVVVSGGGA
ncbi:MAG: anhydro-N-acetylmuramic acid kinase, partial [Elusimicrobia bacterium]|nr:anhydro-N-acetylmuramic acid kinase [Elusimicrobiota bacterium]